ncbi:MAG: class I SAM-dependent methyltransferase [Thermaurantiacus tibetensis]|uniref:class I SAM-dependent methyltransferase n=1 Tax=Thermaurantiacus tibetensis TaxID=2759035 RepID=UPI00188FAFDB|nr:methyltransferase domain-containing protein [Thermaurantiacus tibetensis]
MARLLALLLLILAPSVPALAQGVAARLQAHPLEDPARGVIANRPAIVAALDLRPGLVVADIGAGTGAFMEPIARAVGPQGRYIAVDIDRDSVGLMRDRARALGLGNVEVLLSRPESVMLAPASVDLMVVIDAYHHFDPVKPMLASMLAALRPGGQLVVVDFDRTPQSPKWVRNHVRADKATFVREITEAGFRLDRDLAVPGLAGHFVTRFVKPAAR